VSCARRRESDEREQQREPWRMGVLRNVLRFWIGRAPRHRADGWPSCSAVVTGSEQRSPTHTNAAPSGAAAILSAPDASGQGAGVGRAQHDAVEERSFARRGQRLGALARAGDDDLGAAQPQVERVEQRRVADQVLARGAEHALDQPVGLLAPCIVAGQDGKPHQICRRDGVRIGRRVVMGRGRADHEGLRRRRR
jgi:hypothetical protein